MTETSQNMSPVGWYLGTYQLRFVELGDAGNNDPENEFLVWENTVIVRADDFDEAYEKVQEIGVSCTEPYEGGEEGVPVQWIFEGVIDLLPIYEPLADGAELAWSERESVKLRDLRVRAKSPDELKTHGESSPAWEPGSEQDGCLKADGERLKKDTLLLEALSPEAFAPFGEVIAPRESEANHAVNAGTAVRFHALGKVDVVGDDAHALISIFRAQPRVLPFEVTMLERHPLGSQAFVPMDPAIRYVIVVAESPDARPRAFLAMNGQGINYRRGCWHHPLIALDRESDFLCVDRAGAGANCEEVALDVRYRIDGV